jgi:hypothetical protein
MTPFSCERDRHTQVAGGRHVHATRQRPSGSCGDRIGVPIRVCALPPGCRSRRRRRLPAPWRRHDRRSGHCRRAGHRRQWQDVMPLGKCRTRRTRCWNAHTLGQRARRRCRGNGGGAGGSRNRQRHRPSRGAAGQQGGGGSAGRDRSKMRTSTHGTLLACRYMGSSAAGARLVHALETRPFVSGPRPMPRMAVGSRSSGCRKVPIRRRRGSALSG